MVSLSFNGTMTTRKTKLRQKLAGKKTYLLAGAAIAYLIGASLDWWPLKEQVLGVFGFLGLTTLRAGIAKAKASVVLLPLLFLTGCSSPGGGLFQRTTVVTPEGTNTLVTVNPSVTRGLNTARDIVSAVPTPWSPIAAGALGALSALLGIIAKVKSDKAALLPAVIAGVEAVNNEDVKKAIQTQAALTGVQARLHKEVQRITGALPTPAQGGKGMGAAE